MYIVMPWTLTILRIDQFFIMYRGKTRAFVNFFIHQSLFAITYLVQPHVLQWSSLVHNYYIKTKIL